MWKFFILRVQLILTTLISLSCKPFVNMMAFFPDTATWPESFPGGVEEVKIIVEKKIELHCLLLKSNSENAVLYLQGNAGHIADRLPTLQTLNSYGQNVLGVGYRGYGKSTGRPSEEGIYQDAKICINYLINDLNIPEERITVMGRSIGTTAAIHISQNKILKGLILITPLFNAEMHAKTHNMGLISFLAKNIFENNKKIVNIKCPLLVIHGTRDELTPYRLGKDLYEIAVCKKEFVTIKNAGHNDIELVGGTKYWNKIQHFISVSQKEGIP